MPVSVDVGERFADLGQISGSHAVLTLVLYTWMHSLNGIRSATLNQCKVWHRKWVRPRSYLPRFDTTRAHHVAACLSSSSVHQPVDRHSSRRSQYTNWSGNNECREQWPVVDHDQSSPTILLNGASVIFGARINIMQLQSESLKSTK